MRLAAAIAFSSLAFCLPVTILGAGLTGNENFRVIADDQAAADAVLARAEFYRQQVALEWLGEALPNGEGRTIIGVEITDREDVGLTWPIDGPSRKFHRIWIATSRDGIVGGTLRHEMVHVVLASRFPEGVLPAFADEAAASASDDAKRVARRQQVIQSWRKTGNWPRLASVFNARTVPATDETTYSAACSIADYLLTLGDKPAFLNFAAAGKQSGWDRALQRYYHIESVRQLESQWREWVSGSRTVATRIPNP
jgi:hypothetical protein